MVHFTAKEKEALLASASSGGGAPPCPRCGGACAIVRSRPRRDVSYVRRRLVVRCATCRASVSGEATPD